MTEMKRGVFPQTGRSPRPPEETRMSKLDGRSLSGWVSSWTDEGRLRMLPCPLLPSLCPPPLHHPQPTAVTYGPPGSDQSSWCSTRMEEKTGRSLLRISLLVHGGRHEIRKSFSIRPRTNCCFFSRSDEMDLVSLLILPVLREDCL